MTALERLKALTAWDTEPAVSSDELEAALSSAALTDVDGFAPSAEDWTETYDLNGAAAEIWLLKAAKATAAVSEDTETGSVSSLIFRNCCRMAQIYSRKRNVCINF